MKNVTQNELSRAVRLLNFEQENMSKAEKVLVSKYKIPQYYISLVAHKIFHRLGTYDFTWPPKSYKNLWDQFHQIASEEVNRLNFQN
ncbi:MAG: hypothetical protein AAGA77_11230 [Bacteroidota bacterium]